MTSVSISELQRNLHDTLELTSRGPVTITHNGRDEYVLLSASEYQRLKRRDRQVLGVEEWRRLQSKKRTEPGDISQLTQSNRGSISVILAGSVPVWVPILTWSRRPRRWDPRSTRRQPFSRVQSSRAINALIIRGKTKPWLYQYP